MPKGNKGYFERAKPTIDRDTCTSCGLCATVCGGEPLVLREERVEIDPDAAMGCLGCGQCAAVCPTGSITVTGRNLSPADIVELPKESERATPRQLEALLLPRRSIRHFRQEDVPRELVDRILDMSTAAPMGIPPSQVGVVVFHGRAKVKAFSDDVMASLRKTLKIMTPTTLVLFRPFISRADYESLKEFVLPLGSALKRGKERGDDPILYDAPVALLFHRTPYAEPADPVIAATYAMLGAESLGLGTCLIGLVGAFMERDKKLMLKYGIPKGNRLSLVLLIGHPAVRFKRGVRRRYDSVKFA
jgi:ferredoxin